MVPIGDILAPMMSYHQTPICQRPSPLGDRQPPVLSLLSVWFIFGYIPRSLSSLCFIPSRTALYPCFTFRLCAPLIHFLTHSMTSAYSFLSRTHMPLFFADSFVHITHFRSDLFTNHSHVPYPLCSLVISFLGRRSPIWVNNRVDTSSHASLLHVLR